MLRNVMIAASFLASFAGTCIAQMPPMPPMPTQAQNDAKSGAEMAQMLADMDHYAADFQKQRAQEIKADAIDLKAQCIAAGADPLNLVIADAETRLLQGDGAIASGAIDFAFGAVDESTALTQMAFGNTRWLVMDYGAAATHYGAAKTAFEAASVHYSDADADFIAATDHNETAEQLLRELLMFLQMPMI